MFRIRKKWGRRPPRCTTYRMTGVKSTVYIHHTAGAAPSPKASVEEERTYMRQTQNYHMDSKGWCDIAYNFLVFPSGRVYKGRGWNTVGAHNDGENSTSYGICAVGNYEVTRPTAEMLTAIIKTIHRGQALGRLAKKPTIRGHRDSDATACPGAHLYAAIPDIRKAA